MRQAAYYNEIDPFAAAWLRELIKAGLIADGEVDERSIELVRPDDLRGFTQCHFFAGIGGWSYALRLAGWPDDRRVWTGSCPCQPFSSAGRGDGPNDTRHFWPTWFKLIAECGPDRVFGEQVASLDGRAWLDLVCTDLEAGGYAIGAVDLPACSIGAPHGRQRLWFVAESDRDECEGHGLHLRTGKPRGEVADACGNGSISPLDDSQRVRTGRTARSEGCAQRGPQGGRQDEGRRVVQIVNASPDALGMGHANGTGFADEADAGSDRACRTAAQGTTEGSAQQARHSGWTDAEWLACTDRKSRPIEPGTFPLADGIPARLGRLRGYGNAIVPAVAAAFIEAYCEARVLNV
jgi:DNA (cytosine-5)-methyltransferase 1